MWNCETHTQDKVGFVCLDVHCSEATRFLCSECAIFSPLHKDHLANIVSIDHLLDTSTSSALLSFLATSSPHPSKSNPSQSMNRIPTLKLSKPQVNLYFDLLQQLVSKELDSTRMKVLRICDLEENLNTSLNNSVQLLQERLSSLILSNSHTPVEEIPLGYSSIPKCPSLSNLNVIPPFEHYDNNLDLSFEMSQISFPDHNQTNFYSGISTDITAELLRFLETQTELTQEGNLLSLQSLKSCKLNLSQFESDLNSFLDTFRPPPAPTVLRCQQQQEQPLNLTKLLCNQFTQELNYQRLQVLTPADFFANIGYSTCIAITNQDELPLLRKVSSQTCYEAESVAIQHSLSTPAQRQFFFSILQDNKNLGDLEVEAIAHGIEQMRYISNIHIDFDDNHITDSGYQAIFKSLAHYERLEHIDLRFNRNHIFSTESAQIFADLLNKNKSSLRVLCLTLRSLNLNDSKISPQKVSNLGESVDLNSSSTTSRSSFSTPPQASSQPNSLQHSKASPAQTSFSNVADVFEILIDCISKLDALEVLYLDLSDNNLTINVPSLPQILSMPLLNTVHLVLNQTSISSETAIELIQNVTALHPSPFNHMKIFLKDNHFTFQQQRSISGKYQKIKAHTKNYDLFH